MLHWPWCRLECCWCRATLESICCDCQCLLDVVHAAVAELDCAAVEDFSEFVVFVKMLVNGAEKFASDIGADTFTEWGGGLYQSILFRFLLFLAVVEVGS